MRPDAEGFLYPVIDDQKCIQCGLCYQICPASRPLHVDHGTPSFYAFCGKDDVRLKSSSGGAFTYLAEWVLDHDGVVCGAAFAEDYLTVHHVLIDTREALVSIQQSKYLQSEIGNCYQLIESELNKGRYVLFSGCSCQVAGLKAYLRRDYEKLLSVDVICNSVPSPLAWQAYVKEVSGGRKLLRASFRDKQLGWKTRVHLQFEGGEEFWENETLPYIEPFITGLSTRKSCHLCRYSRMSRQGDITLGDFWGVAAINPTLDDGKGTSLVSVNNERGRTAFEAAFLGRQDQLYEVNDENVVFRIPSRYYQGQNKHPGRQTFFNTLNRGECFSYAVEKAKHCRYDFGIMGWWYGKNYGASLTAFALYHAVEQMAYHPILIDTAPTHLSHQDCRPIIERRKFITKHCDTTLPYASEEALNEMNRMCNGFIVGSDQLFVTWKEQLSKGTPHYYLNWAFSNRVKISYGTSFGLDDIDITEFDKEFGRFYLSRFDALSSREQSGVEIIREKFGLQAEWVLDPVFLLDPEVYKTCSACSEYAGKCEAPFLFAYVLEYSKEKEEAIKWVAEKTGLQIRLVLAMNENQRSDEWSIPYLNIVSVEDWLYFAANSNLVMTDSFHGMCFSLIFKKIFIGLVPWMGKGRFRSLAEQLGLNGRILCTLEDIKRDFDHLVSNINYGPIQVWFDKERRHSLDFLRDSLRIRKDGESLSDYDVGRLGLQSSIHMLNNSLGALSNSVGAIDNKNELLNSRLLEQMARIDQHEIQINQILASKSFRIGRIVTFLPRKIRGGIMCYKENGMRYTIKRFLYKVNRLIKRSL